MLLARYLQCSCFVQGQAGDWCKLAQNRPPLGQVRFMVWGRQVEQGQSVFQCFDVNLRLAQHPPKRHAMLLCPLAQCVCTAGTGVDAHAHYAQLAASAADPRMGQQFGMATRGAVAVKKGVAHRNDNGIGLHDHACKLKTMQTARCVEHHMRHPRWRL